MKTVLERAKSKVVWLTVLSQILVIVALVNPELNSVTKTVATSVLEILTVFGVLNNPTDSENF